MIVLLMGVAGSGKTTVGKLLAQNLGYEFFDGDDFHSAANVSKMSQGIPLTDADRAPWLATMASSIRDWLAQDKDVVLAASALKQTYRDQLLVNSNVKLVFLRGTYDLILSRMQERGDHYMKPAMLRSQFEALEEPENAIAVDIDKAPAEIAQEIAHRLFGDSV
jgi:gluconokinase